MVKAFILNFNSWPTKFQMSEPSICTKVTQKLLSEIKDEDSKRLLELTFNCLAGIEMQDEKQKNT